MIRKVSNIRSVAALAYAIGLASATWHSSVAQVSSKPQLDSKVSSDVSSTFDVVSIRPSKSIQHGGGGVTASGYVATGISLWTVIMYAYYPGSTGYWRPELLLSSPTWMRTSQFDIIAKVDVQTEAQWQNLSIAERRNQVRPMLRAMLKDRCRLSLHRGSALSPIYALIVTKHKPALKESIPTSAAPEGLISILLANTGQGPGVMVPYVPGQKPEERFVSTPMSSLAAYLSDFSDRPIQDKTGLAGKYDFILSKREADTSNISVSDPAPTLVWNISDLGLALKPIKEMTDVLVIDHIERPSEN